MTPSQIQPGDVFNHWKVIKYDHTNEHRIKYFLCECMVCGTQRPVRGVALINGTSTSCSKECSNSLVGQQIGEWKVLRVDKSSPRNYICKCSCGTVRSVFKGSLKQGTSLSCGCLKFKKTKERFEEKANSHIGETYGYLTILAPEKRGNDYWYKCKCKCGNETTVLGKRLFSGVTSSCGCLSSKANELMDAILKEKNVIFKREYKFEDCRDKAPLPFDFAIFNSCGELIGLMELNGKQHYSSNCFCWNDENKLLTQQKHDYIKRKFCQDNHIPFLVIPYQYFNDLEKFLITSDLWLIITKNFNDYGSS